ncbi:sensor histidine kinase [Undibacterium sp. SXout20W]|uniref:sensor histidine kinase n=1 Tax=Undibacterium sp. SXout20W TaxID=3413051 RepID=UPI003BF5E73D
MHFAKIIQHRWQQTYQNMSPGLLKKIICEIPRILIINLICTLLVTFVMRNGSNLFENWVFSNAIGGCCYLLIRSSIHFLWRDSPPSMLLFYLLSMLLAPLGFIVGSAIGAVLFSYPVANVLRFQTNYITAFVVLTCLVSLVAASSFLNKVRMAKLIATAEAEKARTASIERQAMQAQLQLLQAQIEPHMLFNTLANLQGLIAIDTERAQHMLTQLIVYLRATLSSSRAENTTLKHEFTLIQAYLDLLVIRMGKRLSYTLSLPPELEQEKIPPMLLQPLVENAIKHGLEPKLEGGTIHISASKMSDQLQLQVRDTGLGLVFNFEEKYHEKNSATQLGNANIRERLSALYGNAAHFNLTPNTPEGALATLSIPSAA